MVRGSLIAGLLAVPPAAAASAVLRGPEAAAASSIAILIIVANFAFAGFLLVWAAKRAPVYFPAIAMPSYIVRMAAILVALNFLKDSTFIDHTTFAVTFGIGVVALLAFECRLYARTPWLALAFTTTKETT